MAAPASAARRHNNPQTRYNPGAREWLGRPSLRAGHPADLAVYRADPRSDPATLREPVLVMRRGRPVRTG